MVPLLIPWENKLVPYELVQEDRHATQPPDPLPPMAIHLVRHCALCLPPPGHTLVHSYTCTCTTYAAQWLSKGGRVAPAALQSEFGLCSCLTGRKLAELQQGYVKM
jgi:hypothetical protein